MKVRWRCMVASYCCFCIESCLFVSSTCVSACCFIVERCSFWKTTHKTCTPVSVAYSRRAGGVTVFSKSFVKLWIKKLRSKTDLRVYELTELVFGALYMQNKLLRLCRKGDKTHFIIRCLVLFRCRLSLELAFTLRKIKWSLNYSPKPVLECWRSSFSPRNPIASSAFLVLPVGKVENRERVNANRKVTVVSRTRWLSIIRRLNTLKWIWLGF